MVFIHILGSSQPTILCMCWAELENGMSPVQSSNFSNLSWNCFAHVSAAAGSFCISSFLLRKTPTQPSTLPCVSFSKPNDALSTSFSDFIASYSSLQYFQEEGIFSFPFGCTINTPLRPSDNTFPFPFPFLKLLLTLTLVCSLYHLILIFQNFWAHSIPASHGAQLCSCSNLSTVILRNTGNRCKTIVPTPNAQQSVCCRSSCFVKQASRVHEQYNLFTCNTYRFIWIAGD